MKRDVDRVREDGADGKDMEECNVESSAYECNVHLVICGSKKVIDKKKEECWGQNGTLRYTAVDGEGGDEVPSTITEIEWSERKLDERAE